MRGIPRGHAERPDPVNSALRQAPHKPSMLISCTFALLLTLVERSGRYPFVEVTRPIQRVINVSVNIASLRGDPRALPPADAR